MKTFAEIRAIARKRAAYKPDLKKHPSKTDQASAHDTDINIIVQKFAVTGRVPAKEGEPLTGDFTLVPTDLQTLLKPAEYIIDNMKRLPKEMQKRLAKFTPEQLRGMQTDELTAIINPPPKPAEPTPADKPAGDDKK